MHPSVANGRRRAKFVLCRLRWAERQHVRVAVSDLPRLLLRVVLTIGNCTMERMAVQGSRTFHTSVRGA